MTTAELKILAPPVLALAAFLLTALTRLGRPQPAGTWKRLWIRSLFTMLVLYVIAFLPYQRVPWLRSRAGLAVIGISAVVAIQLFSRLVLDRSSPRA
ncbi:MAG TPA: hypothetical protein VLC12_02795 [Terriglobales bacterium]|nr:hypothetical protein [Terriglobales bacterium]